MKQIILFLFILSISFQFSFGQATVSLAWDRDSIQLGEEVGLQLSILGQSGVEVLSVNGAFLDSIISGFQTAKIRQLDSSRSEDFGFADVEILDLGKFNDKDNNGIFNDTELGWERSSLNNQEILTNQFRLRIWEPGQIIAVGPSITIQTDGNTYEQSEDTNSLLYVIPPVDVAALEQDSIGISPIKTIIKEPVKLSDYLIYIYIIALLFAMWMAHRMYSIYRKKKTNDLIEEVPIIIPPHEIALQKLHDLNDKKLWQVGNIKGYQSELTFIIREYVENKFDVKALELTTDEIVGGLKPHLEMGHLSQLKIILQVADLVKFAKSKPKVDIHQEFMDKALNFVRETMNWQASNLEVTPTEHSENAMIDGK